MNHNAFPNRMYGLRMIILYHLNTLMLDTLTDKKLFRAPLGRYSITIAGAISPENNLLCQSEYRVCLEQGQEKLQKKLP